MEGSLGFLFLAFLIIPLPNFFIFCTGHSHSQLRCIDTERHALLTFKQDLIDPLNRLSSWTVDGDCCHWLGVVCHNLTAHVHQLHLTTFPPPGGFETLEQVEAWERSMFGGKLNPSLLDLKHLNYFDLSFNNFSASPIPEFLGSMKSLTSLNLSNARFVGLIPHQLGNLSNLLYLNLEGYGFNDLYVNNLEWLSGLPLLQHLDMSYVNLSKASDWVQLTNTLPSLFELRLSGCQLRPFIPPTPTVNFSSLLTLDLSENYFENTSIPSWIVGLRNLVSLDLSYNHFQGPIPVDLQNMTSLSHLDLSRNNFNSSIPNWLGNLCNLREIRLSRNKWSEEISEILESFSGCLSNRLEILDLSSSQLHGPLTDELGVFKNLVHLSLWNNSISGPLPVSLGNLSSLTYLDLSNNQFNGTLPQSFGRLSKFETLYIDSNKLKGVVSEVHFDNLTSLRTLSASGNQLTLKASQHWIPPFQLETLSLQSWNLGPKFPQWLCSQRRMLSLDISCTQISDMAPPSFWNLSSQFQYLNLSHNLIHGEIPNSPVMLSTLVIDLSSNHFKVLNLGNNNFSGSIPASMGSLTYLHSLHLYDNKFSGKLPSSLKNCEELVIIDVAENRFAGNIPSWIGHRCTGLMVLSLRSNYFHGHIPKELCALTSLQILDLSHNELFGNIPRCVKNFSAMATNNISNDHMNSYRSAYYLTGTVLESALLVIKGNILEYSTILSLVKSIDFSKNSLSGEIPKEVTNLQALQSLNLSYNLLNGSIPMNIGNMVLLESIDFSVNHLSGKIPSSMSSLTFLSHLNLSNNSLIGEIPLSTQLQSLTASSFIGNKLCGPPLMDNCTGVKPNNENTRSKDTNGLEVDWFYVSMALGFVVGFWGVRWRLASSRHIEDSSRNKDSISLGGRGVWKKEEEYVYKTKGCVKTVMVEPITGLGYIGSFIMFAKATTAQPSFAPLPE
nr:lrr receptor-like serine/threonine-protein kinase fls2 [Quercus suber]